MIDYILKKPPYDEYRVFWTDRSYPRRIDGACYNIIRNKIVQPSFIYFNMTKCRDDII